MKDLARNALILAALTVSRQFGVDWMQVLPETEIAASSRRAVIQLREKRLPQWRAKLTRQHNKVVTGNL